MKSLGLLKRMSVWALLLAALAPDAAEGQEEFINRREQARGAYLASPQGIYGHYCAHCHGDDATGGGRLWALELSPPPTDLTALGADVNYLTAAIRDGSTAHGKSNLCPPWGRTISPADIDRLARYVASLGSKTQAPSAESGTPPNAGGEPFPWLLAGIVLAEGGLLWRLLRRKREVPGGVSHGSPLRG